MATDDKCDEAARRIALECFGECLSPPKKKKVAAIIREVVAEPMEAELTRVRALAQRNASRARGMLG